ncbi:hypothetical protein IJC60_06065 [bacterium]|nr:hypothetical protein [bacterium]
MVMNCRKYKAFTLIELMTTTLIMAIIICAAIPFAMKKDIQKRAVAGHIGLFECYYDSSGRLMQHIRTKDGEETRTAASGGKCVFNPNANYAKGAKNFQIVAIGGGGAGGTYNTHDTDADLTRYLNQGVSANDTLESNHIKYLMDHGRLKFGTLSNTGGLNAWNWNGQKEEENKICYRWYTDSCGNCRGYHEGNCPNFYYKNGVRTRGCQNHAAAGKQFCEVVSRENRSNADYISVYNIGPRLCSLNRSTKPYDGRNRLMEDDLPEEDIFQAIYKYYAIAGKYQVGNSGDITYHIKAPSGISSCACLNNPTQTSGCMGTKKYSAAGAAGDAYDYSTHSGILRGAYAGNSFLTTNDSVDQAGLNRYITGFCDSKLYLSGTSFTCGTAGNNNGYNDNACNGSTEKTASQRGFPNFYYRGNNYVSNRVIGYNKSSIDSYSPWYAKISMVWNTHNNHKAQGTNSLNDYGGDVYFRLVTHNGVSNHAIIPRGHHGDISTTNGGNAQKSAQEAISSNFPGYISSTFSSANNPATACQPLSNTYSRTDTRIYQMGAQCSGYASTTCNCVTTCSEEGGCSTSCDSGSASCSDSEPLKNYYTGGSKNSPAHITQTASCTSSACGSCSCTASCTATNNVPTYTDSEYTCEHLNCCNNYSQGSKKYTIRYLTGELAYEGEQRIERNFAHRSQQLDCNSQLYIYRQIKEVPYERAFVASAGQNGAVRQAAYPKIDEELTLIPGLGGVVSGGENANGKPTTIKNENGKVILSAQGGAKGASDKLNDTWVGPCMVFSHRGTFNPSQPGCMARHDIMKKPTYNSLLMANMQYLDSVSVKTGEDYKDMPGLGGDGAYANVFPDRFLLSKAIRDQIKLETTYIGPNQKNPWSKTEGKYVVKGFDKFIYDTSKGQVNEEFLGNGSFARAFKQRYDQLSRASATFLDDSSTTKRDGRVPNFTKATNGNNGAIVIIW